MSRFTRFTLLSLSVTAVVAADIDLSLLVTREVRGAAYPTDRWGSQCWSTWPPPPPPPHASVPPSSPTPPSTTDTDGCSCFGGAARRAYHLKDAVNSPNTLAIDTGAFFSGSGQFFAAFDGNASAEFFAASDYAAYGLTYRDFSAGGADTLARYLAHVRTLNPALPKAVVSNLNLSQGSGPPLALAEHIEPYTIVPLADNRTAAILSLTDPQHLMATVPEYGARLQPFRSALAVQLSHLRWREAPDVIIVVLADLPVDEEDIARAGSLDAAAEAALNELIDEAVDVDVFVLGSMVTTPPTPHTKTNWAGREVLVVPALPAYGDRKSVV